MISTDQLYKDKVKDLLGVGYRLARDAATESY